MSSPPPEDADVAWLRSMAGSMDPASSIARAQAACLRGVADRLSALAAAQRQRQAEFEAAIAQRDALTAERDTAERNVEAAKLERDITNAANDGLKSDVRRLQAEQDALTAEVARVTEEHRLLRIEFENACERDRIANELRVQAEAERDAARREAERLKYEVTFAMLGQPIPPKRSVEWRALVQRAQAAEARVARLTEALERAYKHVRQEPRPQRDAACAECGGHLVIPGFRCVWHLAIEDIPPAAPAPQKK